MRNEWKPIATAPKDGTFIEIFWFAGSRLYVAAWQCDIISGDWRWEFCYDEGFIPMHLTKMVWRELEIPEYKDYEHFFEK